MSRGSEGGETVLTGSTQGCAIVWFRDDLRLADNWALQEAVRSGLPLLCVYIDDRESVGLRAEGGAVRWWRHHSLRRLGDALEAIGGRLDVFRGASGKTLPALAAASGAKAVFWGRRYGPGEIALDAGVKRDLSGMGILAKSFNASLLVEPWEAANKTGGPFKVFTPFWKSVRAQGGFASPGPTPERLTAAFCPADGPQPMELAALALLPTKPDWSGGLAAHWSPGEAGAQARLKAFLGEGIANYAQDRNRPGLPGVSRLSPHLRFGEISPRQIAQAVEHAELSGAAPARDAAKFLAELGWREFSHHLLYYFPDLPTKNFAQRFDAFPWREPAPAEIAAWRRGQTGYPAVDAGMRELWRTGYMHNRVRMIAASFLTKHLLADWRIGEAWFWDTLCDADAANNPAGWQWVAGSGADAAPYFRIFNPVLQGETFDPQGDYVKTYVPELAGLPAIWLHRPWEAPPSVLQEAGIRLGSTYPRPIVDHAAARQRALAAFAELSAAP